MNSLFKRTFFFVACLICFTDLDAQTVPVSLSGNAQQHFLWYTGHWSKDKKNTFITDPYTDSTEGGLIQIPGGQAITVTKDGGVNMNSGDIDNWNKKISDGLKDLEKTQKNLTDAASKGQEIAYHFNKAAMPSLNDIKKTWTSYKVDKKEDVLNSQQNEKASQLKNFANWLTGFCKEKQPQYEAIIDFYNAHRHDKASDYNNLPPPEHDYNCMACDSNLAKKYKIEDSEYVQKFFQPEEDLIKNGIGIMRALMTIGHSNDIDNSTVSVSVNDEMTQIAAQAFHQDKSDPSKSGACAYLDSYKLGQAVRFLVMRCLWRADKLLNDNRKNFKAALQVSRVYLLAARNNEMFGFTVQLRMDDLGLLAKMAFDNYYNKLVKDHDWSQLANIPFILSLGSQYQMTSGHLLEESYFTKLFKLLNSFQLNIEMDIKIGKEKAYLLTHLKGKAKVAPEFVYSANRCYQWVVAEEQPDQVGNPIKKMDQRINVDLLNNQIIVKDGSPTYTGTKKYWCTLSMLKMDYCHPGSDSILISQFYPDPPLAGTWLYPHGVVVPSAINGLDLYFRSIDQMASDAKSGALQQAAVDYKKQAEVAMQHAKELQAKLGNGKIDLSKMDDYQNLLSEMRGLSGGASNNVLARTVNDIAFPLGGIQNNSTTLFKKRYDAKEINPSIGGENIIVYGYYTVEVVYKEQ